MTDALSYFSGKLAHETDASDVYEAQKGGESFVLVDVRGDESWAQGRITGAIHMPTENDDGPAERTFDPQVMVVRQTDQRAK